MATVNFSVPDDVKKAFDRTFARQNKSAVIAELMREAVARKERLTVRRDALRRIAARRSSRPKVDDQTVRRDREKGRA